jgi:UDP-4-amino-4-deoxy-L-arabinose-oxoglutarate aminotransferase
MMKVPFYQHSLTENDLKYLRQTINSPFLTTGNMTKDFESLFAKYTHNQQMVGVMSCTQALELSLRFLGVGPGDEVITTPLTFAATLNVIEHVGAKIVLVDVEEETGNINAELIKKAITKKTKAIMPVHLYGAMCDMKAIKKIADDHQLKIVEDAAHCVEGIRDGIRPGNLGDTACFSFYATKNLTCGEGGAISVKTENDKDKMYQWIIHGMTKSASKRFEGKFEHWDILFPGHKANMSNISASLLLSQIERLDEQLELREKICQDYQTAFSNSQKIQFPKVPKNSRSGRHLFTIWVDGNKRDQTIFKLQEKGIGCTVNYRSVPELDYYKKVFDSNQWPIAKEIGERTISLPLYPGLTQEQTNYVIDSVFSCV